ncbi:MAG: multicopper oxidase domain-containing protein [Pseudomonadota bacterium]
MQTKSMSQGLRNTIFLGIAGVFLWACSQTGEPPAQNPLHIPPLLDTKGGQGVELTLRRATHTFYPDIESQTMGINGSYLGPTVRLHQGSTANVSFMNELGEPTTIHGHGLHVRGGIDGGPQLAIESGEAWRIAIPVAQQAGTSWYHPHLMGKTAEHVYKGLAGLYIIEDENSKRLDLPKRYGVDDLPVVIQDRRFSDGKLLDYEPTPQDMMDGYRGDTLVVNGTIDPFVEVPEGWVRLRLLNGSNARFYTFSLGDGEVIYKIATEGGFLKAPIAITALTMAPGERNEVLVDMRGRNEISLNAELLSADPEDQLPIFKNPVRRVLELRVDPELDPGGSLPEELNTIAGFSEEEIDGAKKRSFYLGMDDDQIEKAVASHDHHNMFTVNGKSMDLTRIDERVALGELERWTLTAEMMPHPFHVHGVSFLILEHHGREPAEADRGWKDTVVISEEPTTVLMRFHHEATEQTPYMYHCHILEHEDGGMMGQFTVQ